MYLGCPGDAGQPLERRKFKGSPIKEPEKLKQLADRVFVSRYSVI